MVAGLLLFDTAFPVVALVNAYRTPRPAYASIDAAYAALSLSVKLFFMQLLLHGYRTYERSV